MSRPYQFSQDTTRSPLDRQPPNLFPAGQPPSFKTNVNRAKTKKWVEAKPTSYDGDDWGEYDEDDEYGVEEQPQPSGPTGFRQQGQGIGGYGQAGRSFTNPEAVGGQRQYRPNSFDAGDERRNFSSGDHLPPFNNDHAPPPNNMSGRTGPYAQAPRMGTPYGQQAYPQHPSAAAPLHVQTNMGAGNYPLGDHRQVTPYGSRETSAASWTHSAGSDSASMDPLQRRDFTPSALPPPLHTRASPVPSSATEVQGTHFEGQGTHPHPQFPPRKSSLSQQNSPLNQTSALPPMTPAETAHIPQRERTPSNPTKPLPFIRPADIYKRMEEERQRERQSLDSGRPSPDSISARPPSIDASPSSGPKERMSSDSLGRASVQRSSLEPVHEDSGAPSQPKPPLAPVAERKSEHGFEGFAVSNPVLARALGAEVAQPAEPSTGATIGASTAPTDQPIVSQAPEMPSLPTVNRLSTFGDEFWSSPEIKDAVKTPAASSTEASNTQTQDLSSLSASTAESTLQHQPSLGFRSVVRQAFDTPNEASLPTSPISFNKEDSSLSQPDSGVSRSNTNSTAGISPILSRVPSGGKAAANARTVTAMDTATPAIAEETNEIAVPRSRQTSEATVRTAHQIPRKPSPSHSRNASAEALPGTFTPGYRRDLNTPSPNNSPARSPAIEAQKRLPEPEEGEIAVTSPVDVASATRSFTAGETHDASTREADLAEVINSSPKKEAFDAAQASKASPASFLESRKAAFAASSEPAPVSPVSRTGSPVSRAGSPTKGRVRDLAGKFNEIADSRRNSVQSVSSRKSTSSWWNSKEDLTLQPTNTKDSPGTNEAQGSTTTMSDPPAPLRELPSQRPVPERDFSFRPKLPGQWESYVTTAGPATPSEAREPPKPSGGTVEGPTTAPPPTQETVDFAPPTADRTPTKPTHKGNEDIDLTPTTAKRPVDAEEPPKLTEDPLAALAAAGNAIGESLMAAIGLDQPKSAPEPPSEGSTPSKEREEPEETPRKVSAGDLYVRPLALDRTASSVASIASSVPPTPPPKDDPLDRTDGMASQASSAVPVTERTSHSHSLGGLAPPPSRPPMLPQMSTDDSLHDTENDRLRKEIIRGLSPLRASETLTTDPPSGPSAANVDRKNAENRESSLLPSIYDSYFRGGEEDDKRSSQGATAHGAYLPRSSVEHARPTSVPAANSARADDKVTAPRLAAAVTAPKASFLDNRFSWENDHEGTPSTAPYGLPSSSPVAAEESPTDDDVPRTGSPLQRLVEEDPKPQLPSAYGGTAETGPAEQMRDVLADPRAAESHLAGGPPVGTEATVGETTAPYLSRTPEVQQTPDRTSTGLHVVNTEPGELPAPSSEGVPRPHQSPSPARDITPTDATQAARIPPFREILALKSASDRISTYNQTREQFATMNTGLSDWVSKTLAANPEHASLASIGSSRPTVTTTGQTGSMRHKISPSISRFTKHGFSDGGGQAGQTPYYQQYLDSASQVPSSAAAAVGSPTAPQQPAAHGAGAGAGGSGGARVSGHTVQAKGKDLLHDAGVFGGKATHVAKGLFAKGKSRFRGSGAEKAHPQPPDAPPTKRSISDQLNPTNPSSSEELPSKPPSKRSISIPSFRRSKSRPSSLLLPQASSFTSMSTSTRDASKAPLPADSALNQSAASTSDVPPPVAHASAEDPWGDPLAPPETQRLERLGVLPSPGLEGRFSEEKNNGGEGADESGGRRKSVLESVVRHAMPPVLETGKKNEPGFQDGVGQERGAAVGGEEGMGEELEMRTFAGSNGAEHEREVVGQHGRDIADEERDVGGGEADASPAQIADAEESRPQTPQSQNARHLENPPVPRDVPSLSSQDHAARLAAEDVYEPRSADGPPSRISTPDTWEKVGLSESQMPEIEGGASVNPTIPTIAVEGSHSSSVRLVSLANTDAAEDADTPTVAQNAVPQQVVGGGVVSGVAQQEPYGINDSRMKLENDSSQKSSKDDGAPAHSAPLEDASVHQPISEPEANAYRVYRPPQPTDLGHSQNLLSAISDVAARQSTDHKRIPSVSSVGQQTDYGTEEQAYQEQPVGSDSLSQRPLSYKTISREPSGRSSRGYVDSEQYPPMPRQHMEHDAETIEQHQLSSSQPLTQISPQRYPDERQWGPRGPPVPGNYRHSEGYRPPVPSQRPPAQEHGPSGPVMGGQNSMHRQAFTREVVDPRQHGAEYQLPGVGPPPSDPAGAKPKRSLTFLQNINGKSTPPAGASSSRERIHPALTAPQPQRGFSYQSTASGGPAEQGAEQKRRRSGFFSPFNRHSSTDAESHLSKESTKAQATDSPTKDGWQGQGIPPTAADLKASQTGQSKVADPKAPKKLQRASTSGTPPAEKRSRFSSLGSLFGRSGSTGHAPASKKLTKSNSKAGPPANYPRPMPSQNSSAYEMTRSQYQPVQPVPNPYASARSQEPTPSNNSSVYAMTHSQHQPVQPVPNPYGNIRSPEPMRSTSVPQRQQPPNAGIRDERGMPPPPGGYYAPAGFAHSHGANGYAAIEQQQALGGRRVSSPPVVSDYSPQRSTSGSWPRNGFSPNEQQYAIPPIPSAYANPNRYDSPSARQQWIPPHRFSEHQPSQYAQLQPHGRRPSADSYGAHLSPQISGQSQMQDAGYHSPTGSQPTISPNSDSRCGSSPPLDYRMGPQRRMNSISETAYEQPPPPSQQHRQERHQERPWNTNLPPAQHPNYIPHGTQPDPYHQHSHQPGPTSFAQEFTNPRHAPAPPLRIPQNPQIQPHLYNRSLENSPAYGYADPSSYPLPMSPASPRSPVNALADALPPPPPPPPKLPMGEYGTVPAPAPAPALMPTYARHGGQHGAQGREGMAGRGIEEEEEGDEPVMRGASYPGQEWAPRWDGG